MYVPLSADWTSEQSSGGDERYGFWVSNTSANLLPPIANQQLKARHLFLLSTALFKSTGSPFLKAAIVILNIVFCNGVQLFTELERESVLRCLASAG